MPYWQLFNHIIWATKNREPILVPEIEPIIHDLLRTKAIGLGATVFALNGWLDHVHNVAAIPPKIALATFIGQIKGVSATKFNKSGHPRAPILWQSEYTVLSFDHRRLPNYLQYVAQQKLHHTEGSMIPILERGSGEGVHLIHETPSYYSTAELTWRKEMLQLG
jgi:putative transposase